MRNTLRPMVGSVLNVDWSRFEGVAALRCTIGVSVPLLIGFVTDTPTLSVFGAVGAVGVGFGSFQGAYRSQAIPMLLAAVAMAFSALVGSRAGDSTWLTVSVVGGWGFAGGLLVALGQSASYVGLQSIIALLIAAGLPTDLDSALGRAASVFGGGLVQILLVVMIWPLRRFAAERRSLARVYESLAAYAAAIPTAQIAPPEPHTLAVTSSPLADPQPFARTGETLTFQALLDHAERIRASLAGLAVHHARLVASDRACADMLLQFTSRILSEMASAVAQGREPRVAQDVSHALGDCATRLSPAAPVGPLVTQLRTAWRTAGMLTAARTDLARQGEDIPRRRRRPVRDAVITLRANLSFGSTAYRHALRLAATLVVAAAIARLLEIPRGYWLPLTVAVMLRPDFHDTFAISLARVAGTAMGAVGAMSIAYVVGHDPRTSLLLALGFVWAMYALAAVNTAAFAIGVTGYVVFVLTLAGVPELTAATDRVINTVIAGVLALCAYSMWPTWTAKELRSAVAAMFEEQGTYLGALLTTYVNPAEANVKALDAMRASARRARSNAEAVIERTLSEPYRRSPMKSRTALGLLAANRRIALAALALHAGLDRDVPHGVPGIGALGEQIKSKLRALGRHVRSASTPHEMPSITQTPITVRDELDAAIADETEMIVDGLDTMTELLRKDDARW